MYICVSLSLSIYIYIYIYVYAHTYISHMGPRPPTALAVQNAATGGVAAQGQLEPMLERQGEVSV